jgi:tRNA(Ile)-lysidine synthase
MPESLAARVFDSIRRYRLFRPGDRVAVAVSGGADSVALLCVLEELAGELGIGLRVVHVNHQLRGEAADADEGFVEQLARVRGLPFYAFRIAPGRLAQGRGGNLEDLARRLRYQVFEDCVRQGLADCVATAHTADDQAETLLARLARGTGLKGLAGIYPVRGVVVRPLLEVRRAELRQYLLQRRQPWHEDASNRDSRRLRARIRFGSLPALDRELGGGLVRHLGTLAELARRDEALLEELAAYRLAAAAEFESPQRARLEVRLLRDPWPGIVTGEEARHALAVRMIRKLLAQVRRSTARLEQEHLERVYRLATELPSGSRVELPGAVVERALDWIVFAPATEVPGLGSTWELELGQPGAQLQEIQIAENGKRLWWKCIDWPAGPRETEGAAALLDADRVQFPVVLRGWRAGDAYCPAGHSHVRKLTRLWRDLRVDRRRRQQLPVLVSDGRPVWASGLPVAADVAVGTGSRRVLVLYEEPPLPEAVADTEGVGQASNRAAVAALACSARAGRNEP